MNDNTIARVHYFTRQYLRTQDFVDEQAYHLAMRRRHNIAHHIWGIVQGLKVVFDEEGLSVQPGMAVDGYGRELIVPERQALPLGAFDDKDSDILDVWLVYGRRGDGAEGSHYRWQEQPLIRLETPDPAFSNRRQPEAVPDGDLDFDPSRNPPDDPQEDWPVFLGQIQRQRLNPNEPYTYSTNPADRPYVRLRGETVIDPAGQATVEIGAISKDNPSRRFAVYIPGITSETDKPPPSLEISRDGQVAIRGDTTLYGDLLVNQKAIVLQAGLARYPAPPWRIYHNLETQTVEVEKEEEEVPSQIEESETSKPPDVSATAPTDEGDDTSDTIEMEIDVHQLRIEMPPETSKFNQVVIGAWSADDKKFKPALTVDGTGTVTVHGNLIVKGKFEDETNGANVIEDKLRSSAVLSPEAERLLQAGLMSGISGANIKIEDFYRRLGLKGLGPIK